MKKNFRITINGKTFEVQAETFDDSVPVKAKKASSAAQSASASPAPTQAAPTAQPTASSAEGSIPSPLAGKVVSIDVKIGQQITEGQTIMTLEAMKMNTVVTATTSGTVATIDVTPGDAVEEGQSLMTLS